MSKLNLPEPTNANEARAYTMMRQLEANGQMSRAELYEKSDASGTQSCRAIKLLRDRRMIYIVDWEVDTTDAVFKIGYGPDMPRPTAPYLLRKELNHPRPQFHIPQHDPILAAFFSVELNRTRHAGAQAGE